MSDIVIWHGQKWYYYRDYYKNRAGKLLHREKYQDAYGPLPPSVDVHHKDGNKKNNDLENLEPLSRSAHVLEHEPRGIAAWDSEKRSLNTLEHVWRNRESKSLRCIECGSEFQSTGMRAKFCSNNCKSANFRKCNPVYYRDRGRKNKSA